MEELDKEFTEEKEQLKELEERLAVSGKGEGGSISLRPSAVTPPSFPPPPPPPSLPPKILTVEFEVARKEQETARQKANEATQKMLEMVNAATKIQVLGERLIVIANYWGLFQQTGTNMTCVCVCVCVYTVNSS